jgi:hypothetical protein
MLPDFSKVEALRLDSWVKALDYLLSRADHGDRPRRPIHLYQLTVLQTRGGPGNAEHRGSTIDCTTTPTACAGPA